MADLDYDAAWRLRRQIMEDVPPGIGTMDFWVDVSRANTRRLTYRVEISGLYFEDDTALSYWPTVTSWAGWERVKAQIAKRVEAHRRETEVTA